MQRSDLTTRRDRDHDVVVIGTGMTGLLTAAALAARGAGVLLVEQSRAGAGQSGRSHGYLHQGYAYRPAEASLLPLFARAQQDWAVLLDGLEAQVAESAIAFSDADEARRATEFWRSGGLPVIATEPPPWLGAHLGTCFRSQERTYDFGQVLRLFSRRVRSAGVEWVRGRVERIVDTGDAVVSEVLGPDGRRTRVSSAAAVLAAGAGAAEVLARSGLPAAVQCRNAHMLVLRGDLPAVSAVLPEPGNHGLFLSSRTGHSSGTTWLVSDFQSFDGADAPSHELPGWWARGVLSVLREAVRPEVLAGVRLVSGYSATKAGLRPSSGTVSHRLDARFLGGRLTVTGPSKLTLGPLAAESAVQAVCSVLGLPAGAVDWASVRGPRRPASPDEHGDAPSAYELWETALPALKEPDLLGGLPDVRTLSSLYSS